MSPGPLRTSVPCTNGIRRARGCRALIPRIHARGAPAPEAGFTLIELMVTLSVFAILFAVAVPSFNDVTLSSRLNSYANRLVASVHLARSEAIKRNQVVTLCVSGDGATCGSGGWEQGWVVGIWNDGAFTVLEGQEALRSGLKVTGSRSRIDFQPTGAGADNATLTLCRASPSIGGHERIVTVHPTGRPSVEKTATGSCP